MKAAAIVALLLTGTAARADSAAVADAERWVALVDAGNYADSWAGAGKLFRDHVTKEAWATAAGATRIPLGVVYTRKVATEQRRGALPGAPDGEYEVIEFATSFANKKDALETIVMAHEPAGWRVDGYFVK